MDLNGLEWGSAGALLVGLGSLATAVFRGRKSLAQLTMEGWSQLLRAQEDMRQELRAEINALQCEVDELRLENKSLRNENDKLRARVGELEEQLVQIHAPAGAI